MKKSIVLWIIAIVLTLASVVYQRLTGPTHPERGSIVINEQTIKFSLLRAHDTDADAEIKIRVLDPDISGQIKYRRFKSHDPWISTEMQREGEYLGFFIPKQPMAGKVSYQITLTGKDRVPHVLTDEPVVMRFKGPVPPYVLWPHVFFMLTWMFLASRTGLQALVKGQALFKYTMITTILLIVGGLILGPLVQKFAFDAFWTGWPFGHDLTDNKTIVAFIFWTIALWKAGKNRGRGWIITAAVVTFAVYLIPHSVLGSEIDYTKLEGGGN